VRASGRTVKGGDAIDWAREHGFAIGGDTKRAGSGRRIVATFDYVDEAGCLLFQSVRYEPKEFSLRHPDPSMEDGWQWNLKGVRRVPYRLPELLEAVAAGETILIVEGEKHVDFLRRWNLAATCNAMGAGKWTADYSEYLRGADVVILPDNDKAGIAHASKVAASLVAVEARVRILDLPGLGPKGDILDWAMFDASDQVALDDLIEHEARQWEPPKPPNGDARHEGKRKREVSPINISSANILKIEVFPAIKYAVKGYVVEGATILAGRPKIGKSWLALDWNITIARGGFCFGDIHCKQGEVLYLALEDNKRRLKSRLAKLLGEGEWPSSFEYATEWPCANEGGLDAIRAWIKSKKNARMVTVDVLETFRSRARGGKENQYAEDYKTIKALQDIAAEFNVAILIITHVRKGSDDGDPIDKISGTLGLSGGADSLLILDSNAAGMTLYGRGRDIEEFTRAVRFNRETCRWDVIGEAADVQRSNERTKILETLKDATEAMTPITISIETGLKRGNVRRLLAKMVKDNEVIKCGAARYAHPDNAHFKPAEKTKRQHCNQTQEQR
jgi:AAA domain